MKKTMLLLLALIVCSLPVLAQTTVYENDFETLGEQPGFNLSFNASTNPTTGRYLGKFAGLTRTSTTLTLTNLPAHQFVTISFDVLVGETWDGNGRGYIDLNDLSQYTPDNGPDIFKVVADGATMVHTTFASHDLEFYRFQSYPGTYPQDTYRPGTGAVAQNVLGCNWDLEWYYTENPTKHPLPDSVLVKDAIYHIDITYTNDTDTTTVVFQTFNLSADFYVNGDLNEWWGLDNVVVQVSDTPIMPLTVCQPELYQKIVPNKDNTFASVYVWGEANTALSIQSSDNLIEGSWVDVKQTYFNGFSKLTTSIVSKPIEPQSISTLSVEPVKKDWKFIRAKLTPRAVK